MLPVLIATTRGCQKYDIWWCGGGRVMIQASARGWQSEAMSWCPHLCMHTCAVIHQCSHLLLTVCTFDVQHKLPLVSSLLSTLLSLSTNCACSCLCGLCGLGWACSC